MGRPAVQVICGGGNADTVDLKSMSQNTGSYPHFGTLAVHSGQDPKQWKCRAVVPPIFSSSIYEHEEPGNPSVSIGYTRHENPTRTALEKCIAACENAKHAMVTSSGTAAMSMVIHSTLKAGDHIVTAHDVYGGTKCYLDKISSTFGIEVTYVNLRNLGDVEQAIKTNTKVVWLDCPSNPTLQLADIAGVAQLAHSKGCLLVVDSTFFTPYFLRPLSLDADIVVHSASKFINGHSDVLMGIACTNDDKIAERFKFMQIAAGAIPGPFDCYLANRGLKTLHVRMRQHEQNAFAVAHFLQSSPYVEETIYPGLPSHPQHELAKRQCTGFGGMVSFRIKGDAETARKFLKNLKVFVVAVSLGGTESLAEASCLMTRIGATEEDNARIGIHNNLIRLSVGLEESEDLVTDLKQALVASRC